MTDQQSSTPFTDNLADEALDRVTSGRLSCGNPCAGSGPPPATIGAP